MAYSFFVLDRSAWSDPHQALSPSVSGGNAVPGHQMVLLSYSGAQVSIGATRIQDAGTPSNAAVTLNGESFASGTNVELDYGFVAQDAAGIQYFVGRIDMHGGTGDYDGSVITAGWNPVTLAWVAPPAAGAVLTVINVPAALPWQGSSGSSAVATSSLDPYSNDARLGSGIAAQAVGSPGLSVPCFVAGTRIETALGPQPIEQLRKGAMIATRDHGFQPLLWLGRMRVPAVGRLAPIRFAPGALGNRRALLVSPAHRMLVTGWRVELAFGATEALVPARGLVDGRAICSCPGGMVDFLHVLLPQHEIILAEGVACESLDPGAARLDGMAMAWMGELRALRAEGRLRPGPAARMMLPGGLGRLVIG